MPLLASANLITNIFGPFGVNRPAFIATLISTLLTLFLLKKFALKPIMQMLEDRQARIAQSEKDITQIKQQLADSENQAKGIIQSANEKATQLIDQAKKSAAQLLDKKSQEAQAAAQEIIAKAGQASELDRLQAKEELRREFRRLVAQATAQFTGKILTQEDRSRLNAEAIDKLDA